MLPCHPLLRAADVKWVCEGELVVGIVGAGKVGKDGKALLDGEAALVVIDYDRDAAIGAQLREPYTWSAPTTCLSASWNAYKAPSECSG